MKRQRLLVLAGTAEARALVEQLARHDRLEVIASLAGATRNPRAYPVETRTGGFGGADGLAAWLTAEKIDLVVDATHPFAEHMSENAVLACQRAETPLIRLERPAWEPGPDDIWQSVTNLAGALDALPHNARVLLATGKGTLEQVKMLGDVRADIWCALRLIDPPESRFPFASGTFVVDRPPYTVDGEMRTFRDHAITHLICKNAGGESGRAKLEAARCLGISVIMIDRPGALVQAAHHADSVEDAMKMIERLLS